MVEGHFKYLIPGLFNHKLQDLSKICQKFSLRLKNSWLKTRSKEYDQRHARLTSTYAMASGQSRAALEPNKPNDVKLLQSYSLAYFFFAEYQLFSLKMTTSTTLREIDVILCICSACNSIYVLLSLR